MFDVVNGAQILEKIKSFGLKPIYHGVALSIETISIFNQYDNVQFFGTTLPAFFPLAIAGAISSLSAELLHDFVFTLIPSNEKLKNIESSVVGMGLAGLSVGAALKIMSNIPNDEIAMTMLIGGLFYGANELIYNEFIDPLSSGALFAR